MKTLIAICLLFATKYTANAQINFEQKNLTILEKIAFTTNYKTIKAFMKNNHFSFIQEKENELILENDDLLDIILLEFKADEGNTVNVCFVNKSKELIAVVNEMARLQTAYVESELKKHFFKIKQEEEEGKLWSKSSYKFQITTDKSDEKIQRVMFLSPGHPEYVK